MIKAIIFDWGDTLSPGIPEGYFPIEKIKRKFKLSDKTINQSLQIIDSFEVLFEPRTIEQERQILINCYKLLASKIKIKDPDSFVKYLLEWSFERATPVLFPNVLDTLDFLSKKNYELGVLTNGWPTRFLEIKKSRAGKYFKTILVSSIIGVRKPEIKAYQIAIKKMEVSPDKILFVDNKEPYLVPAKKLGMRVVFLDRIDFNPDSIFPRIKDISGVVNLT